MKKLICVVLCITMMLSSALLFSSCKKDNAWEPTASKKTVSVDLSDYAVIYGAEMTDGGRQDVNNMLTSLKGLTGTAMRSYPDEETEVVATDDLEILVGKTNRKETQKALKGIKDHGWAIRVFDSKIVIVGTTPFLTRAALSYFSENFVNADSVKGTNITLNQNIKLSGIETASLLDGEESRYVLVYDNRVDDIDQPTSYAYDSDTNPYGGDDVDIIFTVVDQVRNLLTKATQLRSSAFPLKKDDSDVENEYEILIGNMNDRADYREAISKLEADEYGICIRDGKIMLLAWNDVTVTLAYQLFEDMMTSFTETDDAGNTKIELPMNLDIKVNAYRKWTTDFPKPEGEGIVLDGTRDVADNCLEYVYSGTGINNAAYLDYCAKLEDAGFKTVVAETVVEGSTYRTYVNDSTGVFLHVYHSAYTYAAEYGIKHMLPSIRIIASDTDSVTVDKSIMVPQSYTEITKSKITQLKLNYSGESFGNSYVVTLADGSFIVYDGGFGKGGDQDLTNIWNVLVSLHTEAHGKAPSNEAGNQVHVRAWLLSHEHGDHYGVFTQFVRTYGKRAEFKLDRLMFNATSDTEQVNCHNPSKEIRTKMSTLQGYVTGGFDYIKVHTGQIYYFANVKMEVMYTHEDAYPRGLEYFNNSSTIFRMTFTDVGTTMLWLGDSERIGGDNIVATYGAKVKSDMVQVAHHGWNGVREQTYDLIAPDVVWWPASLNNIKDWAQNPNASKWFFRVDHYVAHELASAKMILIADVYNTTMTLTGNESDWRNLKDTVGNKEIVYQNNPFGASGSAAVVDKRPTA